MKELRQMIEKVGLNVVREAVWNETGEVYYEADYQYSKNKNLIAKYFFVPCTAAVFRQLILGKESLVELIERPAFFSLQNDVSWNLYLVCVMEKQDYEKLAFHEKQIYLDNEDYSRKILIIKDEFEKYIPNGKIIQRNHQKNIQNPMEIWERQLEASGMKFCLRKYSSKYVNQFLNHVPVDKLEEESSPVLDVDKREKVRRIRQLHLTDSFRPNCYGKACDLEFSGVNLLDGNNGAGKTSILEAMELIITGEVRKTAYRNESYEKSSEIYIEYNENQRLKIPDDIRKEEKKLRERSWYKYRTDRKTIELNDAFHVYNLYSAEQTFIATYQQSESNINEYLSSALFGLEVRNAEENLKRYTEEFRKKHRQLTDKLTENENELEKYENDKPVSLPVLLDYLNKSYLAFYEEDRVENLTDMINNINIAMDKIEGITEIPSSGYHLRKKFDEVEAQKGQLKAEIQETEKQLQVLEMDRNVMKKGMDRCQYMLDDIQEKKKEAEKLEWNKNRIQIFLQAPKEIHWWRQYSQMIEEKENAILPDVVFFERYRLLLSIESWSALSEAVERYQKLKKTYDMLQKESGDLKEKAELRKMKWDGLQQTIMMIKTYGYQYMNEMQVIEECPLCGNRNISLDKMTEYLEREIQQRDPELERLQEECREKEEYLQRTRSKLEERRVCLKQMESFQRARKELELQSEEEQDFKIILERLHRYTEHEKELQTYYGIKDAYEGILNKKFSSSEYQTLRYGWEELLENTRELLGVSDEISDADADDSERAKLFYQLICDKEKEIEKETALRRDYAGYRIKYRELEEEIEEKNRNHEELTVKWNKVNSRFEELKRIDAFYKDMRQYMKANIAKIDFDILKNQLKNIQRLQTQYLNDKKGQKRRQQIAQETEAAERQREKCTEALRLLKRIRPASEYAKEFIAINIEHISEIFLGLHAPKEFDALRVNDANELVVIRNQEEIPLYRLSTGQKTAVVLAIFFKMNLLLETTPDFILLDEPVANIDDLNTISLLDFVREIYLTTGKQIFFTTANYSIQRLFRRKFSFLEDEFIELSFSRGKELKTKIQKNVYNQERLVEREEVLE